jgi:hypothetical protein
MKNTMKLDLLIAACSLSLSGAAFAECPGTLTAEKMSECIKVEGSGKNYQDWQKNEYQFNLDKSKDTISVANPVNFSQGSESGSRTK